MNILVLNGSPRTAASNTMMMTQSFLDGVQQHQDVQIEQVDIYKKEIEINHCIGCFSCWTKTPGECIFKDDMKDILDSMIKSDVVIWSFPLYYFGLPSKAKACMDRMLPLSQPFMLGNEAGHVARYDLSHQTTIVISSGGLSTVKDNFEALDEQFSILEKNHAHTCIKIFSAQSPLFSIPQLHETTTNYLAKVKEAGVEFATNKQISKDTLVQLRKPMFSIEAYNQMADSSWEIANQKDTNITGKKLLPFTKQMAALYNTSNHKKDIVLEIEFTDYHESYQLLLKSKCAEVISENFEPYTTKIETPFTLWDAISKDEINGATALMEGKYKVLGDLDVMMHWSEFFGNSKANSSNEKKEATTIPKTNMNLFLIPWIAMWIALPINLTYGALITIIVTLMLPILFYKTELTLFDKLSSLCVSVLSVSALLAGDKTFVQIISYFVFASFWLISLFLKKPLSAYYSCVNFGGKQAFQNVIFMKTNAILTLCWGVLYILIGGTFIIAVNKNFELIFLSLSNICIILLGVFTKWFQNWYPKRVMSGK